MRSEWTATSSILRRTLESWLLDGVVAEHSAGSRTPQHHFYRNRVIEADERHHRYEDGEVHRYGAGESYGPF